MGGFAVLAAITSIKLKTLQASGIALTVVKYFAPELKKAPHSADLVPSIAPQKECQKPSIALVVGNLFPMFMRGTQSGNVMTANKKNTADKEANILSEKSGCWILN